jgi:hypothetical protein
MASHRSEREGMAASRRGSTRASLISGLLRGQQEKEERRSRGTGAAVYRPSVRENRLRCR